MLTLALRSVGGIVVGAFVAAIGYWIAAVVALLLMHGIPLGSAGDPISAADVSIHLVFAIASSFVGALVAMRIAGYRPRRHAAALGALLCISAFLGFSKPTSNWPAWFPYGMALACGCGALLASRYANRRSSQAASGGN
jgi:hypothetical protein